ncbi:methyl-accepting chemotaxis protein [Anaeromicrobium sediminis]|uniref:Methyl-accepting chemotaxis protein n=1 Tax=Anaeromicrobium sediminis TaxID=1478221 RepID=A0A267MN08_9FIRM|nr:methyl-accepting chemotaxis protein [Anaeromicrobium sediminis]PAB60308.1 hypothetical protein CCE28_05265 [Anaeromicrobium sediminis]
MHHLIKIKNRILFLFIIIFSSLILQGLCMLTQMEGNNIFNPNVLLSSTILMTLISMVMLLGILKSIANPINKVNNLLKDTLKGDLTKRINITTNNEVGELSNSINLFLNGIEELILKIKNQIHTLAISTNQVSVATTQATQGIEDISNELSEVSLCFHNNARNVEKATIEIKEMINNIVFISQKLDVASESSKGILTAVNIGVENINEIVEVNNEVKQSTKEVYDSIKELKKSSVHIGKIVSIITNISEQTNLLALNATIESARAGQYGKGFAVVAEEVRRLSEESKESADTISSLIKEIQEKANYADLAITKEQQLVETSVEKINNIDEQFENILDRIVKITEEIKSISNSSREQSVIAEDMTNLMNEILGNTQKNDNSIYKINGVIENQVSIYQEIGSSIDELEKFASSLTDKTNKWECSCSAN